MKVICFDNVLMEEQIKRLIIAKNTLSSIKLVFKNCDFKNFDLKEILDDRFFIFF